MSGDFGEWIMSTATMLDGYAQQTTLLRSEALEASVAELGKQIGFADDQLRYVLGMLVAYPLALVFLMTPVGALRHVLSLVSGAFLAQFVFGSGWIHSLVSSVIVYILCMVTRGKSRPLIVFIFMLGYMTASHTYRLYIDYMGWTLDFTGPQMLLTIKLTSMAYALHDGVDDKKNLEKKIADNPKDKMNKIYKMRLDQSISSLPNPLEYFAYVYCFTTYLAGPAFGIREYLDVCNGKKFKAGETPVSRIVTALYVAISSFVFLGLFLWGSAHFPITNAFNTEWLEATAYAGPVGWLKHMGSIWLALLFVRCKYYFGWYLSEGSCIVSGFGYDKKKQSWRGASNMDWWGFETAQSVRAGARAWNQRTQEWLEMCVYHRTGSSLAMTYFVSAFWHGFYPAYYVFFLSVPLATKVNRLAYRRLRPFFVQQDGKTGTALKPLYDIFSFFCTTFTMNYLATAFQMLSLERVKTAWGAMYFAGHVGFFLAYVGLSMIPSSKKKKTA